jgi:hypothetical protein
MSANSPSEDEQPRAAAVRNQKDILVVEFMISSFFTFAGNFMTGREKPKGEVGHVWMQFSLQTKSL